MWSKRGVDTDGVSSVHKMSITVQNSKHAIYGFIDLALYNQNAEHIGIVSFYFVHYNLRAI